MPGNVDMAVKGMLYADSYVDLLAVDISDMDNIREVKRIEDAFPYMIPFCEEGVIENVDLEKGVVTGWKTTERTVTVDKTYDRYREYPIYELDMMNAVGYGANGASSGAIQAPEDRWPVSRYMMIIYTP